MFFLRALLLAAGAVGFSTWPSVSVQMVTYKRGPLLLEALAQVEQQEYPGDLEVVIVDDSPESQEEQLDALLLGLQKPGPKLKALRWMLS
ncbi:Glyco_trans_2-like domain-containing protein [Durusdinium trenchii]|uniref:Glyco_trans_2-like domain-containing protein n=1 Tax=Durusdinium trenchii TaxID=1381693 RepID=A0ABP0QEB6_9DINO